MRVKVKGENNILITYITIKSYGIYKTALSLNNNNFKYVNANLLKYEYNSIQKRKNKDITRKLNIILSKPPTRVTNVQIKHKFIKEYHNIKSVTLALDKFYHC